MLILCGLAKPMGFNIPLLGGVAEGRGGLTKCSRRRDHPAACGRHPSEEGNGGLHTLLLSKSRRNCYIFAFITHFLRILLAFHAHSMYTGKKLEVELWI